MNQEIREGLPILVITSYTCVIAYKLGQLPDIESRLKHPRQLKRVRMALNI